MDDAMAMRSGAGSAAAAQWSVAALEAKHAAVTAAHGADRWRRVGARVLPVFTGEGVAGTIEEGAEAVRSCLRSSEGGEAAWGEIHAIVRVGMASLVRTMYRHVGAAPRYDGPRVKVPSAALLAECARPEAVADALAAAWETLAAHVLPSLEGVFLPLAQFGLGAGSLRAAVLGHFRDALVVPLLPALDPRANAPALLHMLSVLAALTPADRSSPLYAAARALAAAAQAH